MRQIKNYLRSKRTMWNCQESPCATLNAWKCMNEFCGCWEWGSNSGPTPQPTGLTLNITPSDPETIIIDTFTGEQVTFPISVVEWQQLIQMGGIWESPSIMLRAYSEEYWDYIWVAEYLLTKGNNVLPITCNWTINWEAWPITVYEEDDYQEYQMMTVEWNVDIVAVESYDEGWE